MSSYNIKTSYIFFTIQKYKVNIPIPKWKDQGIAKNDWTKVRRKPNKEYIKCYKSVQDLALIMELHDLLMTKVFSLL